MVVGEVLYGLPAVRRRAAGRIVGLGDRAFVAAEDHAAGAGLQHAGDRGGDVLVDVVAAAFDDDHRAVFEVADALARFFARLDDPHLDAVRRAERPA